MYVHPAFKTDDATALRFAAARGFGAVIAMDAGRPVASHVPFLLDTTGATARLEMHVARANPLAGIIGRDPRVLVVVQGPDAYISPDWYTSADQVPTWSYVAVHLSGAARLLPAGETLAHVDRLSARFESELAPKRPWTSAKMTADKRARMLAAIVAFEIQVDGIEAQTKLGQHKGLADRIEPARRLAEHGRRQDRTLAELMAASLKQHNR